MSIPTLSVYESMVKDDPANGQQIWPKVLQRTIKIHDNGVKLLTGTDIPNFDLVPGKSLHHELELLPNAGIPTSNIHSDGYQKCYRSIGNIKLYRNYTEGKRGRSNNAFIKSS